MASVEQAVDEMQVARAARPGADGKFAGDLSLARRREGRDLFVANVNPVDGLVNAKRFGQAVQAVANDAKDPLHADLRQCLYDEFGNIVDFHRIAFRWPPLSQRRGTRAAPVKRDDRPVSASLDCKIGASLTAQCSPAGEAFAAMLWRTSRLSSNRNKVQYFLRVSSQNGLSQLDRWRGGEGF
jgi:hypothetical protein